MQIGNQFSTTLEKVVLKKRVYICSLMNKMAEGQGLEPRFTGPEPVVLPLDDPSVQILKKSDMILG
jgi:hypothetical protein